jgi:hypothetical protein
MICPDGPIAHIRHAQIARRVTLSQASTLVPTRLGKNSAFSAIDVRFGL